MLLVISFYGSNKPVSVSSRVAETASYDTDPPPLRAAADWPAHGDTYAARRSSPLQLINTDSVKILERAWLFHTEDMPERNRSKSKYAAETTALKIGNLLYLCTATNILIARNVSHAQQVWRHNSDIKKSAIPHSASCRGVAYYDAMTGKRCMEFANVGAADITSAMGEVEPGVVALKSPPTIIKGAGVTGIKLQTV
jgi:quinoprotein glucose dehydrogenase